MPKRKRKPTSKNLKKLSATTIKKNVRRTKEAAVVELLLNKKKRKSREVSDRARVIRKRFEDEAKRYERQAKKKGTTEAQRKYLNQAAEAARQSADKYRMNVLRKEFGKGEQGTARIIEFLKTVGERDSSRSMYRNLKSQDAREQRLAERVLSGASGSSFYAGTVQIWRGKTGEARNNAIMEFFNKSNLWQVIQHFEQELGINFFDVKEYNAELYRKDALQIMERVVTEMAG